MKQIHAYKIDLNKIDGTGDFSCPRCGTKISPDDLSEEVYSILEPVVNSHGLVELAIRCNRCTSHIHLTGFSLLERIPEERYIEKLGQERDESVYISHV
jgi:DNA-directed RNA polymerase subunit RPC12/RpoP